MNIPSALLVPALFALGLPGGCGQGPAAGDLAGDAGADANDGGSQLTIDACACITGGDNTGDGYFSVDCRSAGVPFAPSVRFCEDFDAADYAGADGIVGKVLFPSWNGPFDHSWDAEGGYEGGAAKFTAHTFDGEDSDGLFIRWPAAIAHAGQANLGYLLYMGRDWNDSLATTQEWKHTLIYTNGDNGQTAMLMDWGQTKHVWSACSMMSGLCRDELGDQYPNEANNHSFVPRERWGEWLYVELEHIPGPAGAVNVYVYRRDGNVVGAGPMATIPSAASTPHTFDNARILAYPEGACNASGDRQSVITTCTAESYAKIDLVKMADAFIGPPAGFLQ